MFYTGSRAAVQFLFKNHHSGEQSPLHAGILAGRPQKRPMLVSNAWNPPFPVWINGYLNAHGASADSGKRLEGAAERSSDAPAPKLDVISVHSVKVEVNFSSRVVPSCGNHACLCVCACLRMPVWESAQLLRHGGVCALLPHIRIVYR